MLRTVFRQRSPLVYFVVFALTVLFGQGIIVYAASSAKADDSGLTTTLPLYNNAQEGVKVVSKIVYDGTGQGTNDQCYINSANGFTGPTDNNANDGVVCVNDTVKYNYIISFPSTPISTVYNISFDNGSSDTNDLFYFCKNDEGGRYTASILNNTSCQYTVNANTPISVDFDRTVTYPDNLITNADSAKKYSSFKNRVIVQEGDNSYPADVAPVTVIGTKVFDLQTNVFCNKSSSDFGCSEDVDVYSPKLNDKKNAGFSTSKGFLLGQLSNVKLDSLAVKRNSTVALTDEEMKKSNLKKTDENIYSLENAKEILLEANNDEGVSNRVLSIDFSKPVLHDGSSFTLDNHVDSYSMSFPSSNIYLNAPKNLENILSYPTIISNQGNVSFKPSVELTQCGFGTINLVSGDVNNNKIVDSGENWKFTCERLSENMEIDSVFSKAIFTDSKVSKMNTVASKKSVSKAAAEAGPNVTVVKSGPDQVYFAAPDFQNRGAHPENFNNEINYKIKVTNTGDTTLLGNAYDSDHPVIQDSTCTDHGGILGSNNAADDDANKNTLLDPGESFTYVCLKMPIRNSDVTRGKVDNAATFIMRTRDDSLNSLGSVDSNTVTTNVIEFKPSLTVDTTASVQRHELPANVAFYNDFNIPSTTALEGDTINYKFVVNNNGNVPLLLDRTSFIDPNCGNVLDESTNAEPNLTLNPGESHSFKCSRFVSYTGGSVDNTVDIIAYSPDNYEKYDDPGKLNFPVLNYRASPFAATHPSTSKLEDTVSTPVFQPNPSASLTITDDRGTKNENGVYNVGDTIKYTITLTNTGDVLLEYDLKDSLNVSGDCDFSKYSSNPDLQGTISISSNLVFNCDLVTTRSSFFNSGGNDKFNGSIVNKPEAVTSYYNPIGEKVKRGTTYSSPESVTSILTYKTPDARIVKEAVRTSDVPNGYDPNSDHGTILEEKRIDTTNEDTYIEEGTQITWFYRIINVGNYPLTGKYTVTDDKLPGKNCTANIENLKESSKFAAEQPNGFNFTYNPKDYMNDDRSNVYYCTMSGSITLDTNGNNNMNNLVKGDYQVNNKLAVKKH